MSIQIIKYDAYDAHGGPKIRYKAPDGYWADPTDRGRYLIGKIEKHVSPQKYFYSSIPWGSPLILINGILNVKIHGKWIPITTVNSEWKKLSNSDAIKLVKEANESFRTDNLNIDFRYVPDKWIFNDFGHISVKYFKDSNGNGHQDKNEIEKSDFIHTTPQDEIETYRAKRNKNVPQINLSQSHGCIHVKPNDIDAMIAKGYLAKGNVVQVHGYNEKKIPQFINIKKRISLYEAHFFPGLLKMVIYKAPVK
ncbi:MAG: hypothetical protein DI598_01110 [Pseudopedobacter saltans]|uniref:YkuD domain-containing protein n=1 Tax=Pseudopedobacter saltans TaxID=151895 RepID=A0A2W5F8D6_9SPHI|nr:MAG: hypothetical protein DI598_01110 [Pseudopedobacter saltans]